MPTSLELSSTSNRSRYTKAECIGRGASKVVYKAFDEVEGIEVAWNEVLCTDAALGSVKERSRMLGEITMLRQLKHRNIMRLYDWWYDKQQQVLVFITELLTDGSLRRFIRRKHAAGITLTVLKRYAWQILQGLVYLHGHYPPIIHRDLKCDNIFVNGASGELKLGDMGFATLLRGMSAPLSVIGTPEFMAPELYDEHYDEKVDIYSYGMCLLELATLEYPYSECTNPAQIYRKVTRGIPPASLASVSNPQLKDFISLTIDPDPARRPEARQLLVHPFFDDVRQQIRAKGWAKGPAPALGAAAAATSAAAVRNAGAGGWGDGAVLVVGGPGAAVAGGAAGAGRVPLSAPDGLAAAIVAAAEEAEQAAAAAAAGSDTAAAAGTPHLAAAAWPAIPGAGHTTSAAGHVQFDLVSGGSGGGGASPDVDALGLPRLRPDAGRSCGPVLMTAALNDEHGEESDQQQTEGSAVDTAMLQQQHSQQQQGQEQQQQQDQQQRPQMSSAWGAPGVSSGAIAAAAPPAAAATRSASCTDGHSPFEPMAASYSSMASSNGSWGPTSSTTAAAAAAGSSATPGRLGSRGSGDAAAAIVGHGRAGRCPSLDEMSEEDVLFDGDSQGHTDDYDSEHDDDDVAGSDGEGRSSHTAWQHAQHHLHKQQHQHPQHQPHFLDPIREDGDDDEGVDCVCRQIDQQQLSFNVGFFNKGMRKRVGFQYNADEDTVDDITMEMLENLSLMPQQANAIAEKIKAALEALGLPNGSSNATAAAAAIATGGGSSAAAGSSSSSGSDQAMGESAAIAIVATAAASAVIESCSTPQPGSAAGSVAGSSGSRSGPLGGVAPASPQDSSPLMSHAGFTVGADAGGVGAAAGTAAAGTAAAGSPSPVVCPQQLVRELSMLGKEAGQQLLQNLQEDLLLQSLAMPDAAAAAGIEVGVQLTHT